MTKRGADTNLTQDNWDNDNEAGEEVGIFQRAPAHELKMRTLRRAKRSTVSPTGSEERPSIFKDFSAFGGLKDNAPSFSFLNSESSLPTLKTVSFPSFSLDSTKTFDSSNRKFSINGSNEPNLDIKGSVSPKKFAVNGESHLKNIDVTTKNVQVSRENMDTFKFGNDSENKNIKAKANNNSDSSSSGFKFGITTMASNYAAIDKTNFKFGIDNENITKLSGSANFSFKNNSSGSNINSSSVKFGLSNADKERNGPASAEKKLEVSHDKRNKTKYFKNDESKNVFFAYLKSLNLSFLKWVQQHVDKNPLVDLTPVFNDYKTHLNKLKQDHNENEETVELAKTDITLLNGNEREISNSKSSFKFGFSSNNNCDYRKIDKGFSDNFNKEKSDGGIVTKSLFNFGASDKNLANDADKTFSLEVNKLSSDNKSSSVAAAKKSETEKKVEFPTCSVSNTDVDALKKTGFDAKTFSFGNNLQNLSSNTTFTFGSTPKPEENNLQSTSDTVFSFGNTAKKSDDKAPTFSFENTSNSKPAFSFNFGSTNPTKPPTSSTEGESNDADDAVYEPPKAEIKEVQEENVVYEKKVKLFYKKGDGYVDRGVGTLYIKEVDSKHQLLIRALTNLGNILLNIVLNPSLPTQKMKNNVILICVPNPPLDSKNEPVRMLIRVKTENDAEDLLKNIDDYKKA